MRGLLPSILAFLSLSLAIVPVPVVSAEAFHDTALSSLDDAIEAMRKRVKRPDASDSLRYELARLCTLSSRIEDRRLALDLFAEIKRSYAADTRYYSDRARAYEKCGMPSLARHCLEELVRRDSTNVEAYVEIARLRLAELLYHYDLTLTAKMMESLRRALALAPDHRGALFLASLALELAGGLPARAAPALTREGIGFLQRILAQDSTDVPARLLLAVHLADLGQFEAAAREFTAGLDASPDSVRQAFSSLEWTAPRAALAEAASMATEKRHRFEQAYWQYEDPTPLTLLNENQLEAWRRLVLSDFLFGRPEERQRGWETEAGMIFVRYGQPNWHDFDPGEILSYAPMDETPPDADLGSSIARSRAPLRLRPPTWTWGYSFRGLEFAVRLMDRNLNGRFMLDNPSRARLDGLRQAIPVIFQDAPVGRIRHLRATAVGRAGAGGKVRQDVLLGVPLWRPAKDLGWLKKVKIEVVVRDSTRLMVRQSIHYPALEEVGAIDLPGRLDLLLVRNAYDLLPGRYTVSAFVEDSEKKTYGSFSTPMLVQNYTARPNLMVSDLELALDTDPALPGPTTTQLGQSYVPDPLCLLAADRHLNVFYEIYGLAAEGDSSLHQARYTILPRDYVLWYERLVREQKMQPEDMVSFAARAGARGGGLGVHNYMDVIFPPSALKVENGRAAKGTRLSLSSLQPGEYAVIVTLSDLTSKTTTSAKAHFHILSEDQRRELMACAGNP